MNVKPTYKTQTRQLFSFSFFPIKLQFSQAKTSKFYVSVEIEKNWDTLVVSRVLGDLEPWQAANESFRINHGVDACKGLWVLLTTESHGGQKSP